MAPDAADEFDLGPLSWVQGEIDQAIGRGLEALASYRSAPHDESALKHARAHIHQAAGAIQMVGLDAVVAYTDEIERQLARLEPLADDERSALIGVIDRAARKLRIFLDELVKGVPPVPLKLYPEYEAMQVARGVKATSPTELFYPDLAPRAPKLPARETPPPQRLPSYLVKQRRAYQRGLLTWLRGDEAGARAMRDAIAGIENVTSQGALRSFWWAAGALFESLTGHGLEAGFGVKQLAARIDLQIRRVAEGSAKAADRLRREVLYYVAISAPVGPQVQAVQQAYRLAGLIPTAEALNADLVRIQPLLREAREQLSQAKDAWLKFASGRAENLPKLKATLASVHTKAAEVKHGALMRLTSALVERLDRMPTAGVSEVVAMEYATALLLAESAFENFTTLAPDFPRQVDAMLARLDAARAGRPSGAAAAPALDEMSKRAQERVLVAQVGREIQANLRHMEQVLDAFFRDNGKRAELGALAKDSHQIRGALTILGLDDAERLLASCQEQIERYADPEAPVSNDDLESLAEALSGLGFYIEAVEQQRPDRERLIAPLIARRLGSAPAVKVDEHESVEASVARLRSALPALVEEARAAPSDAAARESLRAKLAGLRDDAELIGDEALVAQADGALKELERGGAAALAKAAAEIADTGAAPAPALSDETRRLLGTEAHALDAELLEIYLTEATEVLDTIEGRLKALDDNPGDREALRTIRRGFHTLKGSGRMVGLTDLGELAWGVERVHNRLLDEERPVSPLVRELVRVALASFRQWVVELKRRGAVTPDARALRAAIAAVEATFPGETPAPAPPAAEPIPANEPLAAEVIDITVPPLREPEARGAGPSDLIVELPGVGESSGGVEVEVVDIETVPTDTGRPSGPPQLKLVADNTLSTPPTNESARPVRAPDELDVGGVAISASLHRILVDEAESLLATLDHELSLLQFDPGATPSQSMIRAAHTLCGIHRTGGFPLVAELAKTLELALLALEHAGPPLPGGAQPSIARSVAALRALASRIRTTDGFDAHDRDEARAAGQELEQLRLGAEASGADAETRAALAAEAEDDAAVAAPEATLEAIDDTRFAEVPDESGAGVAAPLPPMPGPFVDPLDGVRDALDADVLPIFLEEAAVLFPRAGDELRAWRRDPSDAAAPAELRRTLHTFKGSARMAGAMRLGELAHRMESRLMDGELPEVVEPAVFEVLDADLDDVAFLLDELKAGRVDVELPWVARARVARAAERAMAVVPAEPDERALPPRAEPESLPIEPAAEAARPVASVESLAGAQEAPAPVGPPADEPIEEPIADASELLMSPSPAPPTGEIAPPFVTGPERPRSIVETSVEPIVEPVVETPGVPAIGAAPATPAPAAVPAAPVVEPADADASARAVLRVRADLIDRLANEAGEVAIARARVEGELRALKSNLLELTSSVIRLRNQVREIEIQAESQIQSRMSAVQEAHEGFDPLEFDRYTRFQELARSLAEGVNDVSTVQQSLLKNLDDAQAALLAQARLSRDVQQRLFAIRTVPFSSLSERLYRILRATARELDKRANLEIVGAQTELDRSVLERLAPPLEHLLRNALDHGIEGRAARLAAGKAEIGEITITVRQAGNEIVIQLADDGAGINLGRVRERAVALGIFPAGANPTPAQLVDCVFRPGFSTASKVTQISGRGVGMDVVRTEIAALGGRVEAATRPGEGTTFTLSLPLTLAVAQVVLVRAGGRIWALPAPMVEQVQQVKSDALLKHYVAHEVEWQGERYAFHYLPRLLGDNSHPPDAGRHNAVLLLRSGQTRAAIHVDEMVGNQEVVVKNIGPQLARVSGIAGATVLGTGEIVLIINPIQLAQRADVAVVEPSGDDRVVAGLASPERAPTRPLVLVVDDSLTVRKITSRLLQREGFDVATARDGLDALQILGEQVPDVILLDIEMPRMDGFEFTRTIKADAKHSHIPIVMITSRTAEKHRARAAELGVDLYLGKPYQEDELLRHLREMLALAS
ncbi:MAG: Hpt domain-containing protein [Burkholderiales bacterium]